MSAAGYGVRIPADVEKDDLILGRLTARQLAVLAVTGLTAWAIYAGLRGLHVVPLVALAAGLPVLALGAGLAFARSAGLPADRLALLGLIHLRSARRRVPAATDPSEDERVHGGLDGLLPPVLAKAAGPAPGRMAPVADGISPAGHLRLGKAGATAVAACGTVNFSLRTPEEQEALTGAFARYLNSITGPVEILVRARRLDLSPVIEQVRRNAAGLPHPALEAAAGEHAEFLAELAASRDLLSRQVLLAVRDVSADSAGRGARLARRVEEASRALSGAGIAVSALGAGELSRVMASGGGIEEREPAYGAGGGSMVDEAELGGVLWES